MQKVEFIATEFCDRVLTYHFVEPIMATVPSIEQQKLLQQIETAHKNLRGDLDAVLDLIDLLETARGMDNKDFPLVQKLMKKYNQLHPGKKNPESPTGSLFPEA